MILIVFITWIVRDTRIGQFDSAKYKTPKQHLHFVSPRHPDLGIGFTPTQFETTRSRAITALENPCSRKPKVFAGADRLKNVIRAQASGMGVTSVLNQQSRNHSFQFRVLRLFMF
ncbi:MAG TPA: hypothetical protein VF450_02645 [Noviherbaspirillum sp.]